MAGSLPSYNNELLEMLAWAAASPPPSQLRVDPLRAVLGKSLSAAGEECGGRAARAVLGEEGECQAFTFLLL